MKGEIYTVGIIGRPNVGKSCLFNALLQSNRSIVLDMPGTTMDELVEKVRWEERDLFLIDTQGVFEEGDFPVVDRNMKRSDAVLFVVDALAGITPFDRWLATELKAARIPTLMVINKAENNKEQHAAEFAELGFEEFTEVSAAHRQNLGSIKEWCVKSVPQSKLPEDKVEPVKVAIVGRPNSGKSTLMNRFCKASVSRVSPIAHTTRDPVRAVVETRQGLIQFIDTAGVRRPNAKKEPVEFFSIKATERTIEDCDVVLLCVASHEDVTDQDMRLLGLVEKAGKPTVVLLNFWDMLDRESQAKYIRNSEFFRILQKFQLLKVSGKTGFNLSKVLPLATRLYSASNRRVPTAKLNKAVETLVRKNPPPTVGKGNFNILYASQVAVSPPTFVFFMNRKEALPTSYRRYVENSLKAAFGLEGQPMRLLFRARDRDASKY